MVQPQIVSHKTNPTSKTEEQKGGQLGQSNDQVLTAAAAASAAVAATQPFLKVCHRVYIENPRKGKYLIFFVG